MRPTSRGQFTASKAGSVPALEQVRDDVWSLAMPMPGGHIPYSLLYLLRDAAGGIHVVDPGWSSDENWGLFTAALVSIGSSVERIESIVATHLHPDHLGLADRMRDATGAPLALHEVEQLALSAGHHARPTAGALRDQLDEWSVPSDRRASLMPFTSVAPPTDPRAADITVVDADRLPVPGFDLRVLWTPGHTGGSICLHDRERGILFTGDHLLPTMFPGLGLGGPTASNPIADYVASMARTAELVDVEALPGHGYRFTGVADRATASAEHHLVRAREVAAVVGAAPDSSVWETASRLTWTAGWQNLANFYLYSALAQTAMHRDFVLAGGVGG